MDPLGQRRQYQRNVPYLNSSIAETSFGFEDGVKHFGGFRFKDRFLSTTNWLQSGPWRVNRTQTAWANHTL